MRYLGNKESMLTEISDLLLSKGLLKEGYAFFDAFCGSGSVADYFKSYYDIIMLLGIIYTHCKFSVIL